eukprot:GHVQ01011948.1.p2 GENE.GHVQ01011948.1~~GHVQ01011948.1.p2  ORF type:complete len:142 (-),score=25.38 GHVQ01011948.1:785-1210(-)
MQVEKFRMEEWHQNFQAVLATARSSSHCLGDNTRPLSPIGRKHLLAVQAHYGLTEGMYRWDTAQGIGMLRRLASAAEEYDEASLQELTTELGMREFLHVRKGSGRVKKDAGVAFKYAASNAVDHPVLGVMQRQGFAILRLS